MTSIAYIAGSFPARSETFVYREVRALRERGWTVHCVSLNPPREPGLPQFADLERDLTVVYATKGWILAGLLEQLTHPLRSIRTIAEAYQDALFPGEPMELAARVKLVFQALAGQALARRLRGRGVRHIHCHFAHAPTSVGMYAAAQLDVPFSFTGHANDLFQRRALLRTKLARAKFVACISRWHQAFYEGIREDRTGKYEIVRCGVDVTQWAMNPPREQISDALRVLSVCRLVDKKGVDTLIRALAGLRGTVPWRLTIAGDGPAMGKLRALSRELKCDDAIDWLGAVDNDRVPGLLRQADVFALPCRTDDSGDRDGIPVVLMEAMACGVPVVGGDLPAIRELIEQDSSGLLVEGNDVTALEAALRRIAVDTPLRRRLAQSARQRVETEFALDKNVARLEQCLNNGRNIAARKETDRREAQESTR